MTSKHLLTYSPEGIQTGVKVQIDIFGLEATTGKFTSKDYLRQSFQIPPGISKVKDIYSRRSNDFVFFGLDVGENPIMGQCILDLDKGLDCQDGRIELGNNPDLLLLDEWDHVFALDKFNKKATVYSLGPVLPTSKSFVRGVSYFTIGSEFLNDLTLNSISGFEFSRTGIVIRMSDSKTGAHISDYVSYAVRQGLEDAYRSVTSFKSQAGVLISIRDNDVFHFNSSGASYTKNMPAFIQFDLTANYPQQEMNLTVTATDQDIDNSVPLHLKVYPELTTIKPQIPELPDIYVEPNQQLIFKFDNQLLEGNNLNFFIYSKMKNRPKFMSLVDYKLNLVQPPQGDIKGYSFTKGYLATWSSYQNDDDVEVNQMTAYICSPVHAIQSEACLNVSTVDIFKGEQLMNLDLSYNETQPLFLVRKTDGFSYKIKWLNISNSSKNLTKVDIVNLPIQVKGCDDFISVNSFSSNSLLLCRQASMIRVFNLTIKTNVSKSTELTPITATTLNLKNFCPSSLKNSQLDPKIIEVLSDCRDKEARIIQITVTDDDHYNSYFDLQSSFLLNKKTAGENGYSFCPFKEEFLILDLDNQIATSYNRQLSSVKEYTAESLGFNQLLGAACSTDHSVMTIWGYTVEEENHVDLLFMRANNRARDHEGRRLIYKTQTIYQDMNLPPTIYSTPGAMGVIYNFASDDTFINRLVYSENYALMVNSFGQNSTKEPFTYKFTASNPNSDKVTKTGNIYIKRIDHGLNVTTKSDTKLRAKVGLYNLEEILDIKGPVLYANLSEKANHIKLSPRLQDSLYSLVPLDLVKTSRDLVIGAIVGVPYLIIHRNYNKIEKSINLGNFSNGISEVDIMYYDDKRTGILAAGLSFVGQENCTVSFFTSFDDYSKAHEFILRQDGSCYSKMSFKRFKGTNIILGFFLSKSDSRIEVFQFIQNSPNQLTLTGGRPVIIDKVSHFSIIQDRDQFELTVVYSFGVVLSTVTFELTELQNPKFNVIKPSINFIANNIQCAELSPRCVADAVGNRLYHFWPLNTTDKGKMEVKLINKYNQFFTPIAPSSLAINSEFVAYHSYKIRVSGIQASVQLFDVSNSSKPEYNLTHLQLINNYTQNSSVTAAAAPFGYVSLTDFDILSGTSDLTDFSSIPKSVLGYHEGGSSWHKLRRQLYLNFTKGFYRTNDNLKLNIVGLEDKLQLQKVVEVKIESIIDLETYSLQWYYWLIIVVGAALIIGGVALLFYGKTEEDVVMDQDGYKKSDASSYKSSGEDIFASLTKPDQLGSEVRTEEDKL